MALPAIAAFVAAAAMAVYCHQRDDVIGAREFGAFSVAVAVWTLFGGLETLGRDRSMQIAFAKFGYVGAAFTPVAFLVFALRWLHLDRWLERRYLLLLGAVPVATIALAFGEPSHGLIWSAIELGAATDVNLDFVHGAWFERVYLPFSYGLLTIAAVLLGRRAIATSGRQRRQTYALLGAMTVPLAANVLYNVSGVELLGVDPTPISFGAAALLIGFALFGTGLLRESPLSYYTVFLHSSDGIVLLDRADRVLDANPAALGDRTARAVRGRPLGDAFPGLAAALERGSSDPEDSMRFQAPNAAERTLEARDYDLATLGGRVTGRAVLIRDVTYEVEMHNSLEERAAHDPLTGLPNRWGLQRAAKQLLAHLGDASEPGRDVALLYIDINGFKKINDTYGHATGDAVLRAIAARLRGVMREHDHIARIGGDEFAALMRSDRECAADALMDRLRGALATPISSNGVAHPVSASIGVARGSDFDAAPTLEQLLDRADKAMYRDKQNDDASSLSLPASRETDRPVGEGGPRTAGRGGKPPRRRAAEKA